MTRPRVFSLARVTGHVMCWIFVVATLFAGGITWFSGTVSYPTVDPSFLARSGYYTRDDGVFSDYYGYIPSSYNPWTEPQLWSLVAFVVVLIAAVIEAISAQRLLPGVVTVAAPCVALGLLLLVTPGVVDSGGFSTMLTMGVVLLAVAVREAWARRGAPGSPHVPT